MATESSVSECAARLFSVIRKGTASDFIDLLDSDDFDYHTTAQAIQRVLEESKPEDWESACVWFFPEVWYRIGGFVQTGSDVEQAIRGIAYRWLALPEWGDAKFDGLRSFALDFLYFHGPAPNSQS
jgi:hypothetical protein